MGSMSDPDVTALLHRWSAGDHEAFEELLPLVYGQLRRLAAAHVSGERQGYTLQPTALVHEAYLRMVQQRSVSFDSRLRFYGAAAQTMRRVLCDRARRRKAAKRGGGAEHSPIDASVTIGVDSDATTVNLEHLDTALAALEEFDVRKARIVELRYFAGLSISDTAAALDLSSATIKREWTVARAWLASQLKQLREQA